MAGSSGAVSWPPWATEAVEVVEASPDWRARGRRECDRLDGHLAPWLTRRVEHVGSTAVPGLPAKPILDLQAAVGRLADATPIAAALGPHGWHGVPPELDGRPWRRLFVAVRHGRRAAHLHVLLEGSPRWSEQLAFRDRLRADPALAAAYAALKRELAAAHHDDREAYTAGKSAFVRSVLVAG